MARAANAGYWYSTSRKDTAEHTLFEFPRWSELCSHLRHPPSAENLPDLLCGPDFLLLPENAEARCNLLRDAEEAFRLFYKLVENIMILEEVEERARQAAGTAARLRP